jgi:hypothetical protein
MRSVNVSLAPDWADEIEAMQQRTGVKPSEVARRALCEWAVSGYIPPAPIPLQPKATPAKRGRPKKEVQ